MEHFILVKLSQRDRYVDEKHYKYAVAELKDNYYQIITSKKGMSKADAEEAKKLCYQKFEILRRQAKQNGR